MNKFKQSRISQGLTLKDLSHSTGIPVSSLSSYERGDRKPKYDAIEKLAFAFGKSTKYLQGRSESKCISGTIYVLEYKYGVISAYWDETSAKKAEASIGDMLPELRITETYLHADAIPIEVK